MEEDCVHADYSIIAVNDLYVVIVDNDAFFYRR